MPPRCGGKGVIMLNMLLEVSTTQSLLGNLLPFVLIIGLLYFMMIRPQQKKDKKDKEMRSTIEVGDEVITIGGVIGRVINVKEDTLVIETGSDRSKIRIAKWAIQQNSSSHERIAEAKAAAKAEADSVEKPKRSLFGKKN